MKLVCLGMLVALVGELTVEAGEAQPAPIPTPTFNITLGGRTACVTPSHSGQARADGGAIDVVASVRHTLSDPDRNCGRQCPPRLHGLRMRNVSPCPGVRDHVLRAERQDGLAHARQHACRFVRSRHKAGAQMKIATAVVAPVNWDDSPLSAGHPMQVVDGTQAQLCNQHLVPLTVPSMPAGALCSQGRVRHRRRCRWPVRRPFRGRLLAVHRPARRLGAYPRPVPGSRQEEFRLLFDPDRGRRQPRRGQVGGLRSDLVFQGRQGVRRPKARQTATATRPIPADAKGFDRVMRR